MPPEQLRSSRLDVVWQAAGRLASRAGFLYYKGAAPVGHRRGTWAMHVAYLVNQYPKVSHTFIRREIQALEALGARVERISVRRVDEELVDARDLAELERTRVILASGAAGLLGALLLSVLTRPRNTLRALGRALSLGWCSERGVLRHFAYLSEACVLRRWLAASGCQHVHAHFGTNSAAVALLCHVLGGPPYSFTVHGPEEFDKAFLIALRAKIEAARFVCAISSFGVSQLCRHSAHEHWHKIHIVHCGLDHEYLQAPASEIPRGRRLVSVGRLSEQKGQLLLVEAAAQLARQGVDFELALVGDGEMREEVEELIARHDLGGRIRITGWATGERVRDELLSARAMVLPSFAEGLPVVIMEALALGRPVLSTYVAGIPELVEPGRSGWLIPAGSVPALVEGMRRVLEAPLDELQPLAAEGRRRVQQSHDASKEASRLLELFQHYAQRAGSRDRRPSAAPRCHRPNHRI